MSTSGSEPSVADAGSVLVAFVLLTVIFGGLLLLSQLTLRPVLCDWHEQRLSYCPGFTQEQP